MPPLVRQAKQINAEIHNAIAAGVPEGHSGAGGGVGDFTPEMLNSFLSELLHTGPIPGSEQLLLITTEQQNAALAREALAKGHVPLQSPLPLQSPSPVDSGKSTAPCILMPQMTLLPPDTTNLRQPSTKIGQSHSTSKTPCSP